MKSNHEKTVRFAIRDFALPSPLSGSIDIYSGYGKLQDGIEIHQMVQAERALEDETYEAEVKISHSFERDVYSFAIDGRMDGIFRRPTPEIEEIKSTFNIHELYKTISAREYQHPYYLQLVTYGYFYFKNEGVTPKLNLHLVSTRNRETLDLHVKLDPVRYEAWLERRLQELVLEAKRSEKRSQRRKEIAKGLTFPFARPREGQLELVSTIENGMDAHSQLMIQAPTGLGKTIGVLYPSLKESLARGQRVIYITPKNSQHSVAEDASDRLRDLQKNLKSLTLTAKSKMCFKPEPLCNPQFCEYAKDYYDKVAEHNLVEMLAKKKKLSERVIKKVAEEFEVCPYQLQLDVSQEADTLICDYNYVFMAQSALNQVRELNLETEGKPNLVIDEAHNLPSRAMSYFSPELSSYTLENMRGDLQALPKRFANEAVRLLDDTIAVIVSHKPNGLTKTEKITPKTTSFTDHHAELKQFLTKYLDSDVEIKPKDPILKLCFYFGAFAEILEQISGGTRPEFFITFQPDRSGGIIRITCCDASQMLKPAYEEFEHVVAFSATLKPFQYYAELSGFAQDDEMKQAEFKSPFLKENRKLLIIPQISTKYSERERNYAKIAETISRIAEVKPGNYFAFFPSFDFLGRVSACLRVPSSFRILRQERYMKNYDTQALIESLRDDVTPTIVLAVQGGVFSEGVDYPGKMIIGAFIVGPPLPSFDVERENMRKYYDEYYKQGFDYAYTFPAMAKAIQAAGRVIRSETDQGIIVLMDGRFLEPTYSRTMPEDWFTDSPRELVSSSIIKEVQEFWDSHSS